MAVYKYRPIDLNGPAIRLLQLQKGTFADAITCDLFDGWLNQAEGGMPYDALSYTWGSTEKIAKITVNGTTMHVTSNLYVALQHLRFEGVDRILWIDATCIDQGNDKERTHQVQQMGQIYKEAEQVIVWLGKGTLESDFTMGFMEEFQELYLNAEGNWKDLAQIWAQKWPPSVQSRQEIHPETKLREGMASILSRPWFQRVWILQEVANARSATVVCGKKSISAQIFAQVPALMGLKPSKHCQAVLDIMPGRLRKTSWWSKKRDLHTLLVRFRESEATDARDIIYALLGISSDTCGGDGLAPDYTRSLQQLIQDTTSFLIFHTTQHSSLFKDLDWKWVQFLDNLQILKFVVLDYAVTEGQVALVKLLLETNEMEEYLKDDSYCTSLLSAASFGHEQIVRLLVEQGAQVDSKDIQGRTPLFLAATDGHEAVVRLLLEQGTNTELKDPSYKTTLSLALINAAQHGFESVVRLLLEHGADVDKKDSTNRTPLTTAAMNGHGATVRLLLKYNAQSKPQDAWLIERFVEKV